MKKTNLFISILLISMGALAQSTPRLGLKAGINLATWNSENNIKNDMRTGFHIGGFAHIHLSPQWAIQPEIQYSSQGAKTDLGAMGEYVWKLEYINIPIIAQYMFSNGFRLEAGPQAGFLTSANMIDEDKNKENIIDEFKKADFSIDFGLSYLTHSGLGFGARYNLGVTNINDKRTYNTNNRVFQLSMFYMFDSRHKVKSRRR